MGIVTLLNVKTVTSFHVHVRSATHYNICLRFVYTCIYNVQYMYMYIMYIIYMRIHVQCTCWLCTQDISLHVHVQSMQYSMYCAMEQ